MARQLLPATDHIHLPKVQPSAPRLLAETHRPYREYGLRPDKSHSGMIPSQHLHLGETLFIQWRSSKTKIIHTTLHFNGSIHTSLPDGPHPKSSVQINCCWDGRWENLEKSPHDHEPDKGSETHEILINHNVGYIIAVFRPALLGRTNR